MNLAETQQLYDTTPNCCRWRDSSRKESWDAGELLVCKRSTVTHKSSQPDPTSRFTAPVPADFPAKMGVTVPCASLCPPPALSLAFHQPTHCNSGEKSEDCMYHASETGKFMPKAKIIHSRDQDLFYMPY